MAALAAQAERAETMAAAAARTTTPEEEVSVEEETRVPTPFVDEGTNTGEEMDADLEADRKDQQDLEQQAALRILVHTLEEAYDRPRVITRQETFNFRVGIEWRSVPFVPEFLCQLLISIFTASVLK